MEQRWRGANSVATISERTNEINFVLAWFERIPFGVETSVCLRPVNGCHEGVVWATFIVYQKFSENVLKRSCGPQTIFGESLESGRKTSENYQNVYITKKIIHGCL